MRKVKSSKLSINIFFLIIFGSFHNIYATNYFISSSEGSDGNEGTKAEQPIKTLAKLNQLSLQGGDTIFFKCGDIFRGSIVIAAGGKPGSDLVYTSYGEGPAPVLSGAEKIDSWHNSSDSLLRTIVEKPVFALFANDKMLPSARFPEKGWLFFEGGGRNFMTDPFLSGHEEAYEGATIRMRTKNWCYEYKKIVSTRADTAFFNDSLWNNEQISYTCDPGWGYYLDNKEAFIKAENGWAFNKESKELVFKPGRIANPEVCVYRNGIVINENTSYLQISGISFEKYHDSGILINKKASNIHISDCSFRNILLKGIDCREGSKELCISNCSLSDVYGQGISLLESSNTIIEKNVIKRIGLLPGYGINGVNGGMGIIVTNHEVRPEGYNIIASHNVIRHNRIDSVGNYAIRMDGVYSSCEYNVVSNALLTHNDGALIYCWGLDSSFTHHNIIKNNIVSFSHGNLTGSPKTHLINAGIYVDNNANHIKLENNTVTGTQIGILFNSLSFNNKAINNTLFDNTEGISFSEFHPGKPIYGTEISQNIMIGVDYEQKSLHLKSYVHPEIDPGKIDGNFHYNPRDPFVIKYLTTHTNFRRQDEMNLEAWQAKGYDINGSTLDETAIQSDFTVPGLFVNPSDSLLTIELSGEYINLKEERTKKLVIEPFSSQILLKKRTNTK